MSKQLAINHDATMLRLHAQNHPDTAHHNESVWAVDPVQVCAGRPVGLMWLSPDCRHFARASGGRPLQSSVRGLAWVAHRWARAVRPRVIVLENVVEFPTWGPLLASGRPCPRRRGQTYRAFVARLERLGYVVETRVLRAADYGAPTSRTRFFLVARCDGAPIAWPTPTYGPGTWRTGLACVDPALPCPSIFDRTRPLVPNTLRRIAAGLLAAPSSTARTVTTLICLRGTEASHLHGDPIDAPLRTIAAQGMHHAVCVATRPRPGADTPEATARRAEVAAFFATAGDGRSPAVPLADIGFRMLTPRELARAQGFPDDFLLDRLADGTPVTQADQVRAIGNSVAPAVACAVVAAQFGVAARAQEVA